MALEDGKPLENEKCGMYCALSIYGTKREISPNIFQHELVTGSHLLFGLVTVGIASYLKHI